MKYPEDFINKIVCGDCLDFMKQMPDKCVDLILTDPPYGNNMDEELNKKDGKYGYKQYGSYGWDKEIPKKEVFDEMFRVSKHQIIWGGNYFTDYFPPSMGWLVWDKGQRDFSLADGELAWTSFNKALRIKTYGRGKALQDGKKHPTQKSKEIIKWCILNADRHLKTIDYIIFDPFLGSGTTAVACKELNRKFIGIEINPEYCKVAENRLFNTQESLL